MLRGRIADVLDIMIAIYRDGGVTTRKDIASAMDIDKMSARDHLERLHALGYAAKMRPHMTYIYKPLYDARDNRIAPPHAGDIDADGVVQCPPAYADGYAQSQMYEGKQL